MKEAFDIALAGVCLSGLAAMGAALLVNAAWVALAKRARAASGRPPARRLAFLAAPVAFALGMILYGGSKGLLQDGTRTTDASSAVLALASESGMASSSVVQADETALSVEASPVLAAAPTNAPTAAPAGAVTDEDIARGWRLVSAATNALASFAMPPDGAACGTWHLCGAYEDVQVVDFGDWKFPAGTGETSKVWAFVWGRLRPALRDSLREILAVDAPMSAIPSVSRLWTAATANGGRLVTWERFALGRIPHGEPLTPERTVNAQVELFPNGGFVTRSNEIERVYARIEPFDWDGDGWHNDDDPDPKAWTGGGFGLVQTLPPEANESAYYWIDIVADFNAPVVFAGDGFSDLADPSFTARAGETNRVTLLVGKSYAVTAARPLRVVGRSSRQVRVEGDGTTSLTIRFPVSFRADPARGGGFAMVVEPSGLGGSFSWTGACCPLTGSGDSFWFACSGDCPCGRGAMPLSTPRRSRWLSRRRWSAARSNGMGFVCLRGRPEALGCDRSCSWVRCMCRSVALTWLKSPVNRSFRRPATTRRQISPARFPTRRRRARAFGITSGREIGGASTMWRRPSAPSLGRTEK